MLFLLFILSPFSYPAEDLDYQQKLRLKNAENFTHFNFEPGGSKLESRDLDGNEWPDFWQSIVDDRNKLYLADAIRIVRDPGRPGLYQGEVGNVLRIPFDGTGVALRTRVPVKINANMAYEISVWGRSVRLEKSVARLTMRWIELTQDGEEKPLTENNIIFPPGQIDWTESPLRLRVNNIESRATHLVLILNIYDNPDYPGADRDGYLWVDDIVVSSRPKIYMFPTFMDYTPGTPDAPPPPKLDFDINYKGLIDNIPVAEQSGGTAKKYYRTAEVYDISGNAPIDRNGKQLKLSFEAQKGIFPGKLSNYSEKISINLERLGVYYITVRLYGYRGIKLAERTQVLGLWLPPLRRKMGVDEAATSGGFGVVIPSVPVSVLNKKGVLASIVERTGARYVKSIVWPSKAGKSDIDFFMNALSHEFNLMRRSGVRITAMLSPPETMLGSQELYDLMKTRPQNMQQYTDKVTSKFDTQIENWQWGMEKERSFSFGLNSDELDGARKLLAGKTSSPSQSYSIALDADGVKMPPVDVAFSATMYVPESFSLQKMLKMFMELTPSNFWRLREPDKRLYPPKWLYDMSPVPEIVDETRQPTRKVEEWVTIGLRDTVENIHNPLLERRMLDDMAKKAVLARMSDMPRIYIDSLIDPVAGLTRIDEDGSPVPMPALLGLRVLDEYLSRTTYLGSFILRNEYGDFPNFVFALPDKKKAVCVVWLEGSREESAFLDFGGGYRLSSVDLQGNIRQLPSDTTFVATRTPQIITGMSIAFARTRMSIRILPNPELRMLSLEQNQILKMTNFYEQSISGTVSLNYAARDNFDYEPNWAVEPNSIRYDIGRPLRGEPKEYYLTFQVRPPDSSPVDLGKEYGEKLVSLRVTMMSDRPQVLRLIRKTDMNGDIRMIMRRLTSPDERGLDIIQMKLRWIPPKGELHKPEILLRPYFRKRDELETLLPTVAVPAYKPNDTDTPPVSIEYRIPRFPQSDETWIGYRQEDGARFFNYNATKLVGPAVE